MEYADKAAVLSDCGTYRYQLSRNWKPGKTCTFVMLNPSTADALVDDPTIRRCVGFAQKFGYGSLIVVNLFALRATNPKELLKHPEPVGPDNDQWLQSAILGSSLVVCGWGAHKNMMDRDKHVLEMLKESGRKAMTLGTTKAGHPKHPLYLPADTGLLEIA